MEKVGVEAVFGIDQAKKNQETYAKGFGTVAKEQDKATKGGLGFGLMSGAGMALFNAGLKVAGNVFSAIAKNIPFLSQSFEMAGNVFMANLFRPLAQELMPLLKEFFAWVRNNRITFVQFGTVLVGVFRLVKSVVLLVFDAFKAGFKSFQNSIGGTQITMKKFMDFMNFLLLKIAFVFTFLSMMITPLLQGIGEAVGFLWKNVVSPFIQGFYEGFVTNIIPILQDFDDIMTNISEIFKKLGISGKSSFGGLQGIFKALGTAAASYFFTPVRTFLALLKLMTGLFVDPKKALIEFGKEMRSIFSFTDNPISRFIENVLLTLPAKIKQVWGIIKETFSKGWDNLFTFSTDLGVRIGQWLSEAFETGLKWIEGTKVGKFLGKIFSFEAREKGGPVKAGQPYIVGEKGPEVFVPGSSGGIVANNEVPLMPMGNSNSSNINDNKVININIVTNDPQEAGREVKRVVGENSYPNYARDFKNSENKFK